MFSKKVSDGKKKHKNDDFDSFSYKRLDDLIGFDKENNGSFDDIDDIVDRVLASAELTRFTKRRTNRNPYQRVLRSSGNQLVSAFVKKILVKQIVASIMVVLIISALVPNVLPELMVL